MLCARGSWFVTLPTVTAEHLMGMRVRGIACRRRLSNKISLKIVTMCKTET